MDMEKRLSLLRRPRGPADVVLDTDTYNEIDDQYALSYLALSGDELNLKAVYAAPFSNRRAETPEKGMDLSYQEILKVLTLLGREDMKASVYRGSVSYLPDENTPVVSEAARDLAQRAMEYTPESPLYVVAIAAITNVASALLLNPAIADRITVIWLGGHSFDWPNNHEFNCYQDVAAARVVMDRAAVVLLPCMGVVSSFATTKLWRNRRKAIAAAAGASRSGTSAPWPGCCPAASRRTGWSPRPFRNMTTAGRSTGRGR